MAPEDLLHDEGVLIVEADITAVAIYVPEIPGVAVRRNLPRATRRSVLAEELAHHRLGHQPQPDPTEWARQELRAHRMAAEWLIPLDRLAEAIAASTCWHDVAEHLDVDPFYLDRRMADLTDTERRTLRRTLGRLELDL